MLTTALSVLEIQFENAEKENKRLRNANSASGNNGTNSGTHRGAGTGSIVPTKPPGDTIYDGSEMMSVVATRARIWRSLASHRLLASMKPLPLLAPTLQSPSPSPLPSSLSISFNLPSPSGNYERREENSTINGTRDPLKTYRDLRKLRSTVKVQQTKRGSRDQDKTPNTTIATTLTVCFHGSEKRRDRLMDFFT